MSTTQDIEHEYQNNSCELKINVKRSKVNMNDLELGPGRHVQNIRNCDIFMEDYYLLMYLDVQLYKFHNSRRFDMENFKTLEINYNTKNGSMLLSLPCVPFDKDGRNDTAENISNEKDKEQCERSLDLWKLRKITDQCYIRVDCSKQLLKPESNFDYGFASKYRGIIKRFECDLNAITRIPEPCHTSPLQRTIDREIDDMKNFSRDQYKLDFVELQVREGHDNPMNYKINFQDSELSHEEECLLHNLTCKPELMQMPDEYNILEMDCSLISILLAICYDVRFTSNETNCESAWTRSTLSPTLMYFEPFTSLRDVVISFMRCSLIYPLYRYFELSQKCVEDCIYALQSNTSWILKQLLITRQIFEINERSLFNYYYVDDYIRYLKNPTICSGDHFQMLAHNLKNVSLDIFKKHLGLGLQELETELLKELITDVNCLNSNAKNDSEQKDFKHSGDDDEATTDESCESERSNSSDTEDDSSSNIEEGSVIELKMEKLKL